MAVIAAVKADAAAKDRRKVNVAAAGMPQVFTKAYFTAQIVHQAVAQAVRISIQGQYGMIIFGKRCFRNFRFRLNDAFKLSQFEITEALSAKHKFSNGGQLEALLVFQGQCVFTAIQTNNPICLLIVFTVINHSQRNIFRCDALTKNNFIEAV